MGYRNSNLISLDYSFEIDTSALEERLESLGGLDEDRVRELIAEDSVSDDGVRDIVRDVLSDEGLTDLSSTYVESDDLDDRVNSVIEANGGYASEYEVDAKIEDALRDFAPDTSSLYIGEVPLGDAIADLRSAGGSYEDRLKRLEDRLDALTERNETALTFFGLLKQAMALLRN